MNSLLKIIAITFVVLLFTDNVLAGEEVKWRTWDEGYKESKEKNIPMLVNVYTDWCGWCRRMDADTYKNSEIAKYINENFIPVKFNPELNKTYQLEEHTLSGRELLASLTNNKRLGYPTTLFLFTVERRLFVESGYQAPDRFDKTLAKIIKAKEEQDSDSE